MVFSSVTFLFLFLPIVLGCYHLLFLPVTLGWGGKGWIKACNAFLLLASLLFYFWGENYKVLIFVVTTFVDFAAALVISGKLRDPNAPKLAPGGPRSVLQRTMLIASVSCNVAILIYFKYFNFFVESFSTAATRAGLEGLISTEFAKVALPLGISFFIFHSMSYTIDVYSGTVLATRSFIDYACYVLMFPQLVAGPIVRFSYVERSLRERRITLESFSSGLARFIFGLSKKVLIANNVAVAADKIFALPAGQLSTFYAWLGLAAYTLQIYFDFSGYSDMAVGLGRMLGFELPENFNYPYIARTVRGFWRRWHLSLSTWFQDYLYIPLGGSRVSPRRTYCNLLLVFFLCGLWHGAQWTFVAWGLYHGAFLIIERNRHVSAALEKLGGLSRLYALVAVMFGWVLFRAESFEHALSFYSALLGGAKGTSPYPIGLLVSDDFYAAFLLGLFFSTPVAPLLDQRLQREDHGGFRCAAFESLKTAGLAALLLLCGASLVSGTHNPFIYFRF